MYLAPWRVFCVVVYSRTIVLLLFDEIMDQSTKTSFRKEVLQEDTNSETEDARLKTARLQNKSTDNKSRKISRLDVKAETQKPTGKQPKTLANSCIYDQADRIRIPANNNWSNKRTRFFSRKQTLY